MEMKKLFSLALLVSAFAAAPIFAMNGDDTANPNVDPEPKKSWCPLNFKKCPVVRELSGITDPVGSVKNYGAYVSGVFLHNPIKAAITFGLLVALYNNLENIKSAVGLGEDESDVEAGEIFASADKCGCENAEAEAVVVAEEEAKEEVCEFKKKETKKVQA